MGTGEVAVPAGSLRPELVAAMPLDVPCHPRRRAARPYPCAADVYDV